MHFGVVGDQLFLVNHCVTSDFLYDSYQIVSTLLTCIVFSVLKRLLVSH